MIAIIVFLSGWGAISFANILAKNQPLLLFLWFFIPVTALWLGSTITRNEFSIFQLTIIRKALLTLMGFIAIITLAILTESREYFKISSSGFVESIFELALLSFFVLLIYLTWWGLTNGIKGLEAIGNKDESIGYTSEGVYDPNKMVLLDSCRTCFTPRDYDISYCPTCGREDLSGEWPSSAEGELCFYHPNLNAFAYCCICSQPICKECNNSEKQELIGPSSEGYYLYRCKSCTEKISKIEYNFRFLLQSKKCCAKHRNKKQVFVCQVCALPLCERCAYFIEAGRWPKKLGEGPYCLECYWTLSSGQTPIRWLSGLDALRVRRKTTNV